MISILTLYLVCKLTLYLGKCVTYCLSKCGVYLSLQRSRALEDERDHLAGRLVEYEQKMGCVKKERDMLAKIVEVGRGRGGEGEGEEGE